MLRELKPYARFAAARSVVTGLIKEAELLLRVAPVVAALATVIASCTQQGRLLVEVDSGVMPTLTSVSLRVRRQTTPMVEGESVDFALSDTRLPLRFGVEPVGGSGLVRIEVIGLRGGVPVVESTATVNILPGPTRILRVYLTEACDGVLGCADDETCVAGACETLRIVEPEELPSLEQLDGGTDVPMDAPTRDAGSCTSSCPGCCEGEVCRLGSESAACGSAGAMCLACPAGHLCSSGACALLPTSRWAVVLEHLEVPARTLDGVNWDSAPTFERPDPYVEVIVGFGVAVPVATTMFVDDTTTVDFMPPFAVGPVLGSDLEELLLFRVLDDDATQPDEQIGSCEVTGLSASSFTGRSIESMCPTDAASDNHGFTLRWHLEPR